MTPEKYITNLTRVTARVRQFPILDFRFAIALFRPAIDAARKKSKITNLKSKIVTPYGANLCRYSIEVMKAFTISALMKFPLNWFSLPSQKSYPL